MKKLLSLFLVVLMVFYISPALSVSAPQNGLTLEYQLYMDIEDHPRIEIKVSGLQDEQIRFHFKNSANIGAISDISSIFTGISVYSSDNKTIPWKWEDAKTISLENGENRDFTIKYDIDAMKIARMNNSGDINQIYANEKFVLFRKKAVFFIAADVLMLPSIEPQQISLRPHFPQGVELHASLPFENNTFIAVKDMWGNLVNDFSKAYFLGGKTTMNEEYKSSGGNTYKFLWFDWRDDYGTFFPAFSDKKAAAKKYMETVDLFARYYSDFIAPLPEHQVIIADQIPTHIGLPMVGGRASWYNYMQLWQENTMLPQISHHVYHGYSFMGWFSKLSVHVPDGFLYEGLSTYYEHMVTDLLLGEDYFKGRLYGYLMLDRRGTPFGIKNNEFHKRYNESSLKVYLLNKAIKSATNGEKDIKDFTREMWSLVKDNQSPQSLSEEQVENSFSKTAGSGNINLYRNISQMKEFDVRDFSLLYKPFLTYTDKVSKEYFWDSTLLFLCYMDICSAMGSSWPHSGLMEHSIVMSHRRDAMTGFKRYLQSLGKTKFTREDVIKAMSDVTGKDHSGFFEYWSLMGIELNPDTLPALNAWYPERNTGYSTGYIPSMSMFAGNIPVKVVLKDKPLALGTQPIIQDGRLLVPLRAIVEALGAQVVWNGVEKSITITTDTKKIQMKLNERRAFINNSEYLLDAAPVLSGGTTMVPLRFISEATGCKVYWYDLVRTAIISKE